MASFPSLALAALALVSTATSSLAHMQMVMPYPFNSPVNPNTPEASKDYNMLSPLVSDGAYPCKGFIGTADQGPRQSWTAGQSVAVEIGGSAVHGGGSCQFSLSYDDGVNFHVIESYIGGCLTDSKTFSVKIPDSAPAGDKVIFSWSWFNLLGNREMYQNCLYADIASSSSTPLDTPTIMVANAAVNQCSTIENTPVVFTAPGDNVIYGGIYKGSSIGNGLTAGAGVVGTDCFAPGSLGANGGGSASTPVTTTSPVTTSKVAASTSTAAVPTSSTAAPTSSAAAPISSAAAPVSSGAAPVVSSAIASISVSSAVAPSSSAVTFHLPVVPTSSSSVIVEAPTQTAETLSSVEPTTTSVVSPVPEPTTTDKDVSVEPTSTAEATVEPTTTVNADPSTTAYSEAPTTTAEPPVEATTTAVGESSISSAPTTTSAAVSSPIDITSSPPTPSASASAECEHGAWSCAGEVLTRCVWGNETVIVDCSSVAGTVCSANMPVGCIYPWQLPAGGNDGASPQQRRRMLDQKERKSKVFKDHRRRGDAKRRVLTH